MDLICRTGNMNNITIGNKINYIFSGPKNYLGRGHFNGYVGQGEINNVLI
jgi:hypothetical protein